MLTPCKKYWPETNILTELRSCVAKSYGTARVKVRWNFSDEALWISDAPTNL